MATFAVVQDSLVVNTIIADTLEIAQEATGLTCVEYTEENPAGIGWVYDGTAFIAPVEETAPTE